jgi:hypothetical protein
MSYEIMAEGVKVAQYPSMPSQLRIDQACISATRRGWNGNTLEIWRDGKLVKEVRPSDEALQTE